MKRWTRRKIPAVGGVLLLVGFAGFNVVAYRQARAMTHFSRDGERTGRIEELGGLQKARILLAGINLPRPRNRGTPARYGLEFETVRVESSDGITLEAWCIPGRVPDRLMILFHGYGSEKSALLDEAKIFSGLGYAVLMPDFRGSGGSGGDYTTIGFAEASDVAAVCRYARSRWPERKQILYGQSMGAAAVLRAIAMKQIQPDGIVLESVFDSLLNTVNNRFSAMRVPAFPASWFMVFWGGAQFGFNGFAHKPVEYARSVKCPALFLHGALDPRASAAEGRCVFESVPGPAKAFHEFAGCRHESLASARSEEWTEVVRAFLNGSIAID